MALTGKNFSKLFGELLKTIENCSNYSPMLNRRTIGGTIGRNNYTDTHIAQNITETRQKYFQYFIAIEMLSQHFRQILQDISSQNYNSNF